MYPPPVFLAILGIHATTHGGHGGGDWRLMYRLIRALQTGTPPDMDVYDAAAWSCITELSEKSVTNRSNSMDFPDFTRDRWKTTPSIGIIGV